MNVARWLMRSLVCIGAVWMFVPAEQTLAQVESAQAFVQSMVRDYFRAIEIESLPFMEANYHFTSDQARETLLSQFKLAFDMADTKIEEVDISDVLLHDEQKAGVAFVRVKGVLTESQSKETQTKVHHYAVVLLCDGGRWKIAKVMRRADYDNAIRIAAEAGTSALRPGDVTPQDGGDVAGSGQTLALHPVADNYVYAYSYSNWNNTNWGAYGVINAGWHPTGGEKRSYLKFDLPAVEKVDRATLRLYHYHMAGSNSLELGVHGVTRNWREGAGTYPPTPDGATKPGDLTWSDQPTFVARPAVVFMPSAEINAWVEIDVTSLVNEWLGGLPNHGLVIKAQGNLTQSTPECVYGFWSREYKDPGLRPLLLLDGHAADAPIAETPTPTPAKPASGLFFDDFSQGAGQWDAPGFEVNVKDGQLFWNDPAHRPLSSRVEIPIEDVVIEFDARCDTDGLPIRWYNNDEQGYGVTLGAWYNTRSVSEFGRAGRNAKWVMGKHLELKQWQHFKIVRYGGMLEAYVDGKKVIARKIPTRIEGKGPLRFYSHTNVVIDNVRVRVANARNVLPD